MKKINNISGFGLIEVTIIIITIGILAAIAMQSMTVLITDQRKVSTEREMEMLADAIRGNAEITNDGKRADFGYIGDVGSFPPNLDALKSNPGGYSSWDGPYIQNSFSEDTDGFKTDEWGNNYLYNGGTTLTSTNGLTKKIADASSDYLLNSFNGTILDGSSNAPGSVYVDSVEIKITVPNGIGGYTIKNYQSNIAGGFTLDSLPVGHHPLEIIYTPNVDTLYSILTILPRNKSERTFKFTSAYFSSGGGSGSSSSIEILRPDGSGSITQLIDENCSANWQCVDEDPSDDNTTYVRGDGNSWNEDLYSVENSSINSGTIDSIIVYINIYGNHGDQKARTYLRTDGVSYQGVQLTPPTGYSLYSTTYVTNPSTSSAWTWTEINNLEIGAGLRREARLTQVWVEVYYTE